MRAIKSQSELEQIHQAGTGFIYNDFVEPDGVAASKYNVLHRAHCRWLNDSNLNVPKLFAETQDAAVDWLEFNRGREGFNWRWCKTCRHQSAPAVPRDVPVTNISRPSQSLEPFTEDEVEDLLIHWFQDRGFPVKTQVSVANGIIDLVVHGQKAEWIIEVKGEDKGGYTSALMNFQVGIGQLVSRMTDPAKQYALAIPVTADYRNVVDKYIESIGPDRLGIYFLTVDRAGNVRRFEGSQLKELGIFMNQDVGEF